MPGHGMEEDDDKPCRACNDFKSWAKNRSKETSETPPTSSATTGTETIKEQQTECPMDKEELGRASWALLHSMASYYPKKPTRQQAEHMTRFFTAFAEFYPCTYCSTDFQDDIKKNPPRTASRDELARWLCERHNTVNMKLDKDIFDCSKVHERWRDGWKDGSCN